MKKPKLAIIGASYLQLPLVIKAQQMGVETHCFAWEEGAVCKGVSDFFYPVSILEKEEILALCQKIGIEGITTISSDVATLTVSYVAEKMGLVANSYNCSLVATNKYKMRQKFYENNVSSPKFIVANDKSKFEELRYPLIVKPTDRSGSRGVFKVENEKELYTAINRAEKESFVNEAIVEEFIEGTEVSVEAISWKGQHYFLSITDKITTGTPYFVELEHHQPSSHIKEIQNKIYQETLNSLNALNIQYGASHSEMKINKDGKVFVIEVGARMGGDFIGSDLVYLSSGYDFLKAVIDIAFGKFEEPIISQNRYSGVYFLCKQTEQIKHFIVEKQKYPDIIQAEMTNENIVNAEQSADRSGYFIYQSNKKFKL